MISRVLLLFVIVLFCSVSFCCFACFFVCVCLIVYVDLGSFAFYVVCFVLLFVS